MITTLKVNPTLSPEYDIVIDTEIDFSHIKKFIVGKQVLVVTNTTIQPLYLELLLASMSGVCDASSCILEDGEIYKSQKSLDKILTTLLECKFTRASTVLIALGGGVIGDITGFAASIYQRGVDFLQIPTTVLSQVDSSVGGKTAINHNLGKNMIGSFYQPKMVYTSISFYKTLVDREYTAGLAEVVKYGFISKDFYSWLDTNKNNILAKDNATLIEMIKRSCNIKAQVVAEDEKEISGARAILNFGHTFGHAVEKCQEYKGLKHGEAVGIGMDIAIKFSQYLGCITTSTADQSISMIKSFGLSVDFPTDIDHGEFYDAMITDKKNSAGKLKFILMNDIGQLKLLTVEKNIVIKFLDKYFDNSL